MCSPTHGATDIALSTAWTPEGMNIRQVLEWGIANGFRKFELGISPAPFVMKDVLPLVREGQIEIVSIHNVCSENYVSEGYRRGDPLSALAEERRRFALKKTFETLRVAHELGAQVVILHLGKIEVRKAKHKHMKMIDYLRQLGRTKDLLSETKRLWKMRMEQSEPFLRTVVESLKMILEKAGDVVLGIENRYYFHEIPSPDELDFILEEVESQKLRFWYDTGHAATLEALGLVEQREWLDRFSSRMVGVHFHDMVDYIDHFPPGSGSLDFEKVGQRLGAGVLNVMELNARHTPQEVLAGREFLRRVLGRARPNCSQEQEGFSTRRHHQGHKAGGGCADCGGRYGR